MSHRTVNPHYIWTQTPRRRDRESTWSTQKCSTSSPCRDRDFGKICHLQGSELISTLWGSMLSLLKRKHKFVVISNYLGRCTIFMVTNSIFGIFGASEGVWVDGNYETQRCCVIRALLVKSNWMLLLRAREFFSHFHTRIIFFHLKKIQQWWKCGFLFMLTEMFEFNRMHFFYVPVDASTMERERSNSWV